MVIGHWSQKSWINCLNPNLSSRLPQKISTTHLCSVFVLILLLTKSIMMMNCHSSSLGPNPPLVGWLHFERENVFELVLNDKYRVFFLTGPPDLQYQNEKQVAANQD